MGKLNMLIPNYKIRYTKQGKGEKIKYLAIDKNLCRKSLEEDIKEGAVQFKECLEIANKGLSRVVMISCTNEEDGYMAVSYLAAMENERIKPNPVISNFAEALEDTFCEEEKKISFDEMVDKEITDVEDLDEYGNVFDMDDMYRESPYRIPVLNVYELLGDGPTPMFWDGPVNVIKKNMDNPKKPYWHDCVNQPVCILVNQMGRIGAMDHLQQAMERFAFNRNVYIILQDVTLNSSSIDEDNPYYEQLQDDSRICTFVLENTADYMVVYAEENELEAYRMKQFDRWLEEFGVELNKNFPKKSMLRRILDIDRASKSELMSLVLKYVIKNKKNNSRILTKEDFTLLSKFKSIGVMDTDGVKLKSSARLEQELIGMDNVKQQVREIVDLMNYNRNREEMGFGKSNYHNVHLLIGAPGTAKTTVAKLMGEMMCEQRLITGNRFISVNGADLKGMYVGHSAPKTKAMFENYDIILIDEAYSLMTEGKGSDSFSQEAMAQLIIEIEEHAMDKLVFFAGYGGLDVSEENNRMKHFIDGNPGLKSRINSTIYFESYSPEEMVEILHCQAKNFKYKIDRNVDDMVRQHFASRVLDSNFGNGREARSLLENATLFAATRVMRLPEAKRTKKAYETITYDDVKNAIKRIEGNNVYQTGRKDRVCGFISA